MGVGQHVTSSKATQRNLNSARKTGLQTSCRRVRARATENDACRHWQCAFRSHGLRDDYVVLELVLMIGKYIGIISCVNLDLSRWRFCIRGINLEKAEELEVHG